MTCDGGPFIFGAIQLSESISGAAGHQQPGAIWVRIASSVLLASDAIFFNKSVAESTLEAMLALGTHRFQRALGK